MKYFVGFDTETDLIRDDTPAPQLVCASIHVESEPEPELYLADDGIEQLEKYLDDPLAVIVIQNAAYDLGVVTQKCPAITGKIWKALAEGRIWDTMIVQKVLDNYAGLLENYQVKHSLAALAMRYEGVDLSGVKKDPESWRMRYTQLLGVPIAEWPRAAVDYAKDDATWHMRIAKHQDAQGWYANRELDSFRRRQIHASYALRLMTLEGVVCDPKEVRRIKQMVKKETESIELEAKILGVLREDGTKDTAVLKDLVARAYDNDPPRTKTGQVSTSRDTLAELPRDTFLRRWGEHAKWKKLSTSFVRSFENGAKSRSCPSYYMMKATGRTSSGHPNIQQVPRDYRHVYIARPGRILIGADYSQIEGVCLAQHCLDTFGFSKLADAINAGKDTHEVVAEELVGASYDSDNPDHKKARQVAKMVNYGRFGAMGAKTLGENLRKAGFEVDDNGARELCEIHSHLYPDVKMWVDLAYAMKDRGESLMLPRIGFARLTENPCALANTAFQAPAAFGALGAVIEVQEAAYLDPYSPLYGYRGWAFIHDEIIVEGPEDESRADKARQELERIMLDQMKKVTPDVAVKVESWISERWRK